MTEIHFRLPSNLPYAYVEVRGTPEEIEKIDPEALASLFANAMYAFKNGEARALDLIKAGGTAKPAEHKVGDTVTVGGLEFTKHSESPFAGEDLIADQLGATEIDNVNEPPYKAAPPAAKQKPWEKEKPAPKVSVDIDGW